MILRASSLSLDTAPPHPRNHSGGLAAVQAREVHQSEQRSRAPPGADQGAAGSAAGGTPAVESFGEEGLWGISPGFLRTLFSTGEHRGATGAPRNQSLTKMAINVHTSRFHPLFNPSGLLRSSSPDGHGSRGPREPLQGGDGDRLQVRSVDNDGLHVRSATSATRQPRH